MDGIPALPSISTIISTDQACEADSNNAVPHLQFNHPSSAFVMYDRASRNKVHRVSVGDVDPDEPFNQSYLEAGAEVAGGTLEWSDNWSSDELRRLINSINEYGTTPSAISYFGKLVFPSRPIEEIQAKVDWARELVKKRQTVRCKHERRRLARLSHHKVVPPKEALPHIKRYLFPDRLGCWTMAALDVIQHKTKYKPIGVRTASLQTLNEMELRDENQKMMVSDSMTSRGYSEQGVVNWERVRGFVAAMIEMKTSVPGITPLEASIILSILDDVEEEATQISEEDKAMLKGLLVRIQLGDMKDFEPEVPMSTHSAVMAIVDPLRTRLWDIPAGGADFCEPMAGEQNVNLMETVNPISTVTTSMVHPMEVADATTIENADSAALEVVNANATETVDAVAVKTVNCMETTDPAATAIAGTTETVDAMETTNAISGEVVVNMETADEVTTHIPDVGASGTTDAIPKETATESGGTTAMTAAADEPVAS